MQLLPGNRLLVLSVFLYDISLVTGRTSIPVILRFKTSIVGSYSNCCTNIDTLPVRISFDTDLTLGDHTQLYRLPLVGLEPKLVTLTNCGEDNGPSFPWAI